MRVAAVFLMLFLTAGDLQAATHTVVQGESLWRIAKKHYGNGERWRWIWAANRKKIRRPNHIRPGQKLTIPQIKPSQTDQDVPAGYRYWKTEKMVVRAYDPAACCCQKDANGRTSTGRNAWILDGCAVAETLIPYGTKLWIPGAGWKVADDTGPSPKRGAKKGQYRIEIRMGSHRKAMQWGKREKTVKLYVEVVDAGQGNEEAAPTVAEGGEVGDEDQPVSSVR